MNILMKRNTFILRTVAIIVLTTLGVQMSAQTSNAQKEKTVTMEDRKTITIFHIDSKKVSKRAFHKFLSNLTQVEGTWQCTKTKQGGITSYDATAKAGRFSIYWLRNCTGTPSLPTEKFPGSISRSKKRPLKK
jgi:hypothetical protein